jgi:DNA-binding beta-propeller fold protein YncE
MSSTTWATFAGWCSRDSRLKPPVSIRVVLRATVWRARGRRSRSGLALGLLVAGALIVGLLAGCGGSHPQKLLAAEPAHDPTAAAHLAGHSVRVGADPQGIAVQASGGLVAVGVHSPTASVVLLSAQSGRVLKRIPIAGAPRHLALAGPNGPLLVPEERDNRLLELQLPSGRAHSYPVGDFPHAAAAIDGRVFVGDERGGSLSEILADGKVRTIGGFQQPGGLAPVDGDMAVVDVGAFTLSLLDVQSGRIIGRLPAGRGPTHDVADLGRVYVLDTRGNAVLTYSASPFRQIGRTPLAGSPYGVALDPVRHRLWVTETATNRLAELSVTGPLPRLIRTFATGLQPDTVAVDNRTGRVFVANQISGTVQIIDPAAP